MQNIKSLEDDIGEHLVTLGMVMTFLDPTKMGSIGRANKLDTFQ